MRGVYHTAKAWERCAALAAQDPQRAEQRRGIRLQRGANHGHTGGASGQAGRGVARSHSSQREPRMVWVHGKCAFQGSDTESWPALPGFEDGREQQGIEIRLDCVSRIMTAAREQDARPQIATRVSGVQPTLRQMQGPAAQGPRKSARSAIPKYC